MESPQKLVEHMGAKHKDDFLQFACSLCNKSNPRLKGIAIHYGLCSKGLTGRGIRTGAGKRGESVPETIGDARNIYVSLENITDPDAASSAPQATGDPELTTRDDNDLPVTIAALHECSECHEKFRTKSGLGQHIRHRHPCLSNERRIQAAKADIERKRAARPSSKPIAAFSSATNGNRRLTDEEVGLLFELESKFEGVKFINKAISEHLKSKTLKQISDKRRALATTAQRSRPPVKGKSATEQTATPTQGSQQGPSHETGGLQLI